MLRPLVTLAIIMATVCANAQSWCAPGAQWLYKPFFNTPIDGYSLITYVGDTTIEGVSAQRCSREFAFWDYLSNYGYATFSATAYINTELNGLVREWDGAAWDTLYWFSGQIGDHWNVQDDSGDVGWYEIIDTVTVTMEGTALRKVTVAGMCSGQTFHTTEHTARLGGDYERWVPPPCAIGFDGYWPLACYRDDQLGPSDLLDCIPQLPLATLEQADRSVASLHPNPGDDQFTLTLPSGDHHVEIIDATGRRVLEQRNTGGAASISANALSAGLYTVVVSRDDDQRQVLRWTKR